MARPVPRRRFLHSAAIVLIGVMWLCIVWKHISVRKRKSIRYHNHTARDATAAGEVQTRHAAPEELRHTSRRSVIVTAAPGAGAGEGEARARPLPAAPTARSPAAQPTTATGPRAGPATVPRARPTAVPQAAGTTSDGGDEKVRKEVFRDLFDRIAKTVPKGDWGPEAGDARALAAAKETGCNILKVPFDPADDERCAAYMADVANWEELKPMGAVFDSRTIKFRVIYKVKPLEGILKVPQLLFPHEPYSEMGAFVADRVLQYNRIPPTAFFGVPLDVLKAGQQKGKDIKVNGENVGFSSNSWVDWVSAHVFEYGRRLEFEHNGRRAFPASVQLWMADVNHLLDTVFKIPYRAHNGSWHRYFNPQVGLPPDIIIPLHHISQILTFDYIIGNNDRSPNKNNYVVGGCANRRCKHKGEYIRHPGPPDFVYIDQGMAFGGKPHDSPLSKKDGPFCVFRSPIVDRLRELQHSPTLGQQLLARIPKGVVAALTPHAVESCQGRLDALVKQVDLCLTRWPKETVLVP